MKKNTKRKLRKFIKIWDGAEKEKKIFKILFLLVVILNLVFMIHLKGTKVLKGLVLESRGFVEAKIINEQIDHLSAVKGAIADVDGVMWVIENELKWPSEKKWLSENEREILWEQMSLLEEASYNLKWVANEYYEDYTIQYYPRANSTLASYVFQTRHLKVTVDRLVRTVEGALLMERMNQQRLKMVEKGLQDVDSYIELLAGVRGDIHLIQNGNK